LNAQRFGMGQQILHLLIGKRAQPETLRAPLLIESFETLGHETSDRYIGIYKRQLSIRDQEIFAAVAGGELEEAGYRSDVKPIALSEEQKALWRELDGRTRAATMDAPEGHIVYESYNDWLVDQREERKRRGLWKDADVQKSQFPIGHPHEEMIMGQRAWRYWKDYLCVKRRYAGKAAL
jgi:hypothetical protein